MLYDILLVMELYHVLNRGVDKRNIVMDNHDRWRFIHNLYAFNDRNHVLNLYRAFNITSPVSEVRLHSFHSMEDTRERIIDIHAWCLMENHYHLILSERVESGISLFLQKLNGGYSHYFNERHTRSGALFQGKTKKKPIDSDAYFLHILNYIHLNPLDYVQGAQMWRGQKIDNIPKALTQLETYRWSSYLDYAGKKNIPSILTQEIFKEIFDQNDMGAYLKATQEHTTKIAEMFLE